MLHNERSDLLIVHGDTSSALGGALAADDLDIPLAHVEAGLRSFDPLSPWPEEENRVAIDRRSDLLFAPTIGNADNLRREAVGGAIAVTGNSGIDALLDTLSTMPPPAVREGPTRLLVTCHRRENWGAPMRGVAGVLAEMAAGGGYQVTVVLHPNPQVAAAMRGWLGGRTGIDLIAPLGHREMVVAMLACDILLSDSGGVQEEAPALGIPLLVLRDKTERPEGLASGSMELTGTDPARIRAALARLSDPERYASMARRAFPFGDGNASARIADGIAVFLAARSPIVREA